MSENIVECFYCRSYFIKDAETVEFRSKDGRRITFCLDCAASLEREGVITR